MFMRDNWSGPSPDRREAFVYPSDPGFRSQTPYIVLQRLKRQVRPILSPQPFGFVADCPATGEVFMGIPKVATRSIKAALTAIQDQGPHDIRCRESSLAHVAPQFSAPLQLTAVVRNPWARAYSAWSDKIARLDREGHRARRIARFKGLYQGMPFEAFVHWLASPAGADANADRHWMSQHRFLTAPSVAPNTTIVLKLENLRGKIKLFGKTLELPVANTTGRDATSYRTAYTPLLRTFIAERYSKDINRFGYTF